MSNEYCKKLANLILFDGKLHTLEAIILCTVHKAGSFTMFYLYSAKLLRFFEEKVFFLIRRNV